MNELDNRAVVFDEVADIDDAAWETLLQRLDQKEIRRLAEGGEPADFNLLWASGRAAK